MQVDLAFKDRQKKHSQKFYFVCDFEWFLTPQYQNPYPNTKSHIVDEHMVSGFCCHRVTSLPQYQTPPTLYSGPDVMTHFYDHAMSENKIINDIMPEQVPITPLTKDAGVTLRPKHVKIADAFLRAKITRCTTTTT